MRSKQQFCAVGHDKTTLGAYSDGRCRPCAIKKACAWGKAHPRTMDNRRRNTFWKQCGIINADKTLFTYIDYDRNYQIQRGCCLGCGIHQSELKTRLHTDHDHSTGIFRFLLCMNCNRALGHAQDNSKTLRKLADLLEGK